MKNEELIVDDKDLLLITGANGFIGLKVVEGLLLYGFKRLRCFVRPSGNTNFLDKIITAYPNSEIEIFRGNLLSTDDCNKAAQDAVVIYHLAAGRGEKSFPAAFLNSVVTTRNLLDATRHYKSLKRFVNVSSFAVYSNAKTKSGDLLDESSPIEEVPHLRSNAYCYAKVKQEELLEEYHEKYNIPYVTVRPGAVYGPGNTAITSRVGIGTFGFFLHLGGTNRIPLTFVDNCADAIILSGIKNGVSNEVFNIVDDDLPTSRQFLKMYKKNVGHFKSIYLPKAVSFWLCLLWEKYSDWSKGQLSPVFNRKRWAAEWQGNRYSNAKLKKLLGWKPRVPFDEATRIYFKACKEQE